MSGFLCVPLKKPYDVDIVRPLNNFVKSSYTNLEPEKAVYLETAVEKFNLQRKTALWKSYEELESSLEIIYGYYDQLNALESKILAQDLQIPFRWKDAFDKGSIFGSRMTLTLSSLAYEKLCVMFNIAALQSKIASSQNLETDEGLKVAAKLFQQSAGIFDALKNLVPSVVVHYQTSDLNTDTLTAVSSLMLAQAQEVFTFKAIKDNMKDLVVAKLCCQCEDIYSEALRFMQKDSVRNILDKEWISVIAGKQIGLQALTMYYQSCVSKNDKAIGEQISRLQKAIELFKIAQSRSGNANYLEDYLTKSEKSLADAKKDNDFIYNEIIPDITTLSGPGKAKVAKCIFPTGTMSGDFKDIFDDLMPVPLTQAICASENRKNDIINREIMKLREATQLLNNLLSSYNLPAAIEIKDKSLNLPPSLLEKATKVRASGGIDSLRNVINELPELLKRNREILDETAAMLLDESNSDEQLKLKFGDQWTRTPSDKLTLTFKENIETYRKIIDNAIAADKTVYQKFESNQTGFEMLSLPPEELSKRIPTCADANEFIDSDSLNKLRKLMDDVETLKTERNAIESELRSLTINLKEQFLSALSTTGTIDEPTITMAEIGKITATLKERLNTNLTQQESIIAILKEVHSTFIAETGSTNLNSTETQLASAFDLFSELQSNLRDGVKFYNDLTQLLIAFQSKVSDFCFARKTEKEELMKDLTKQASKQTPLVPVEMTAQLSVTPSKAQSSSVPMAPYPIQPQGMPIPYNAIATPYASAPPPMPQGFNPYATLPYPGVYQNFPQSAGQTFYGTYPGAFGNQQNVQQQTSNKPFGW